MQILKEQIFTGERALFQARDLAIEHSIFENGESALKESQNIVIKDSIFRYKYPLWYSKNIKLVDCIFQEEARAGLWYLDKIELQNSLINAPKTFRKSKNLNLNKVELTNALETFWNCENLKLNNSIAKGDYFAINSLNIELENFNLVGNYAFDGSKNIKIKNSKLLSKDAFWNSENVVVENSFIAGEYIGWNSKNLSFINCTIESLQGFCYIENLKLVNCNLIKTNLAFEYCKNIDIEVVGKIDSIKNPYNGKIVAQDIGEVIFDDKNINPNLTEIKLNKNV